MRGDLAFTPSSRFRFDVSADYSHDDAALNVGAADQRAAPSVQQHASILPLQQDPADYDFKARTTPGLPEFNQAHSLGGFGHRRRTT